MITISQLARQFGLSRATILFYEREGLIQPALRSDNGYRWFGEAEIERLELITAYRGYGVSVEKIRALLDPSDVSSQADVLRARFQDLEREIKHLKTQQHAIAMLLNDPELEETNTVTKERWVKIMQAAGLDEKAMLVWHQKFEELEPEEHQRFLASLGIDEEEIKRIRRR